MLIIIFVIISCLCVNVCDADTQSNIASIKFKTDGFSSFRPELKYFSVISYEKQSVIIQFEAPVGACPMGKNYLSTVVALPPRDSFQIDVLNCFLENPNNNFKKEIDVLMNLNNFYLSKTGFVNGVYIGILNVIQKFVESQEEEEIWHIINAKIKISWQGNIQKNDISTIPDIAALISDLVVNPKMLAFCYDKAAFQSAMENLASPYIDTLGDIEELFYLNVKEEGIYEIPNNILEQQNIRDMRLLRNGKPCFIFEDEHSGNKLFWHDGDVPANLPYETYMLVRGATPIENINIKNKTDMKMLESLFLSKLQLAPDNKYLITPQGQIEWYSRKIGIGKNEAGWLTFYLTGLDAQGDVLLRFDIYPKSAKAGEVIIPLNDKMYMYKFYPIAKDKLEIRLPIIREDGKHNFFEGRNDISIYLGEDGATDAYLGNISIRYPRQIVFSDKQEKFICEKDYPPELNIQIPEKHNLYHITERQIKCYSAFSNEGVEFNKGDRIVTLPKNQFYKVQSVQKVEKPFLPDLKDTKYIIIAPQYFEKLATSLLEMHKGFNPVFLSSESIYANYSFGKQRASAIKEFCKYAAYIGSPEYIQLIGNSSWDTAGNLPNGVRNLLPTYMTSGDIPPPASDLWFTKLTAKDDFPDLMISRISASSNCELKNYINKLAKYPTMLDKSEQPIVSIITDIGYEQTSDDIYLNDFHDNVLLRKVEARNFQTVTNARLSEYDIKRKKSPLCTAEIIENFNSDLLLYIGHGGPNVWSKSHLLFGGRRPDSSINSLSNFNKFPFVVNLSCLTGAFHHSIEPFDLSISEDIIFSDVGGIGVWATTASAGIDYERELWRGFVRAWTKNKRSILGQLVLEAALASFAGGEPMGLSDDFVLLGDVALKLPTINYKKKEAKQPSIPELPKISGETKIKIQNASAFADIFDFSTSVFMRAIIENIGTATATDVNVSLIHIKSENPDILETVYSNKIDRLDPKDHDIVALRWEPWEETGTQTFKVLANSINSTEEYRFNIYISKPIDLELSDFVISKYRCDGLQYYANCKVNIKNIGESIANNVRLTVYNNQAIILSELIQTHLPMSATLEHIIDVPLMYDFNSIHCKLNEYKELLESNYDNNISRAQLLTLGCPILDELDISNNCTWFICDSKGVICDWKSNSLLSMHKKPSFDDYDDLKCTGSFCLPIVKLPASSGIVKVYVDSGLSPQMDIDVNGIFYKHHLNEKDYEDKHPDKKDDYSRVYWFQYEESNYVKFCFNLSYYLGYKEPLISKIAISYSDSSREIELLKIGGGDFEN